jgi:hypothetical protein
MMRGLPFANAKAVEDEERNEIFHPVRARRIGPRDGVLHLGCTAQRCDGECSGTHEKDRAKRVTTSAGNRCDFRHNTNADCTEDIRLGLGQRPAEPIVDTLVRTESEASVVVVDVQVDRGSDDDGKREKQRNAAGERGPGKHGHARQVHTRSATGEHGGDERDGCGKTTGRRHDDADQEKVDHLGVAATRSSVRGNRVNDDAETGEPHPKAEQRDTSE